MIAIVGCGSDDSYNLPPGTDSGPRPDGSGSGSDASTGDDGGATDGSTIDGPNDGSKPTITIVSPTPGALIAGTLRLEVEVDDDTGISNVTATISGTHEIPMMLASGKTYVGTIDTLPLAGQVAPTIVVRAVDLGGEMTELGYSIVLDNNPPIGAFDPPNVRLSRIAQGALECSVAFDPMGSDTPNDGESVPQLIELRARVLDLSNTGSVSTPLFIPHAGTSKVELFVFDDTTQPLVVDSGTDGVCDAINPHIVPATVPMLPSEAAVIDLDEVQPGGTGYFPSNVTYGGSNAGTCSSGMDADPPQQLCFGESVSAAIKVPFTTRGQIYGIPPASESNCLGFAFDALASNISDGWACAAVLVEDALGNRSVSAPLRICIDKDGVNSVCGPYGSTNPPAERPSCTGKYNASTGQVTNTPCTPREFPRSNVANDFELIPL